MPRKRYWHFLLLSLCVSAVFQVAYLVSHPFPSLLGGLYLEMAATVAESGALVPPTIEGFTTEGIPFAYPPLGFYVIAIFLKLGVDGVQLLRFGAPIVLLCNVALLYHLTVTLTDSLETGLVAGIITGTHVTLNLYLVGASGFVRGLGFLFMLVAMFGAYRWFAEDGGRVAFVTALVGWALVLLTHPVHAAAAGTGVFAAWLVWDRSPTGLAAGAGIAAGGLILASPWWLTVVSQHGPGIFFNGAGSHGSLNHDPYDFVQLADWLWAGGRVMNVPSVFALVGSAVLVTRGDWHRIAWLAAPVAVLVPPHGRLGLLLVAPIGATGVMYTVSMLTGVESSLPEGLARRLEDWDIDTQTVVTVALLALLVGPFVAANVSVASDSGPYSALPAYVDEEDQSAMGWIENETAADTQVAVVGGVSEWFPYLTDRTSVIVKYGTEWQGEETWDRHQSAQSQLTGCWNASCVDGVLREYNFSSEVDYVYVPYGAFISGRRGMAIAPSLHRSLLASDRFTQVYRNEGVGIYGYNRTAVAPTERRQRSAAD